MGSLVFTLVMAGSVLLFISLILSINSILAQSDAELGIEDASKVKFKNRGEKFDEDFAILNKDNSKDVKAEESYRCGIFYAGELGAKPIRALHVLPKRFKYDCDSGKSYEEMSKEIKKECGSLFELMGKGVTYESKSRFRGEPYSIGDDICRHIKVKAGIRVMPPNKRFPKGVPMGMYYNFCGRREWLDTEVRIEDNVCCKKRNPEMLYEVCP